MANRLLITGANGYLGSACLSELARQATHEVVAVWHAKSDRLDQPPPSHIQYEMCDLTSRPDVERLFKRWDIANVIHTAALLPDESPEYLYRTILANVVATTNLVDCAADSGCGRFVYSSSISVYGDAPCPEAGWDEDQPVAPSSIYAWSKHAAEEVLRLRCVEGRLSGTSLRLAGIHGQGRFGGVVFNAIRSALAGEPIVLNDGRNPFQLLFVDDGVAALLSALEVPEKSAYERINVASHTYPSLTALAEDIVTVCESASPVRVGRTGSTGRQIMNTNRMSECLRFSAVDPRSRLREIKKWLAIEASTS
jgi:nucleoside-diphosphate-sugar epimerase